MRRLSLLAPAAIAMLIVPSVALGQSPSPSSPSSSAVPVELSIDCASFEETPAQTASADIPVEGTLVVTLCSNPSTGYSWSDPVVDDPGILAFTGSTSEPAASPLPGAPGTQILGFEAIAAGSTTVNLSYDQPWEGGEKGTWTLALAVSVGGSTTPPTTLSIACDAFEQQPAQTAAATIPVGTSLVVTLCSNASTGYSWSDPVVGDPAVLGITGSTAEPPASPLPGAPGTQTFTLNAIDAGTTSVTFSYDQPWEGGEKGAWTLALDVTVG
jgi:predicted secreted protein